MGKMLALCLLSLSTVAAQAGPAPAPAKAPAKDARSAQAFVQGFYDWYTQQAKKSDPKLSDEALANKHWPMSAAIVTALKADAAAQAKSPNDLVGIDFDPFLASQEECWPYKTGKVTDVAGKTRVEVFGVCERVRPEAPDVSAELEQQNGQWVFVNFIYPGDPGKPDDDLLSVLKELKEERAKYPASNPN